MYAQLLKENRELRKIVNELVDEVDKLETRVAKLEGKKPKHKPKTAKVEEIQPIWERKGFKTKKEWKENKR